jgi:Flp pilus assembly protein TadG
VVPRLSRRAASSDGQALVELAFVFPVIIFIIIAIIVGGDMFNSYITVTNAARDGARRASVGATEDNVRATIESDIDRLRGSFDPDTQVTITKDTTNPDRFVVVEVCYEHPHLIPIPVVTSILSNPKEMCSTTKMPLSPFAS